MAKGSLTTGLYVTMETIVSRSHYGEDRYRCLFALDDASLLRPTLRLLGLVERSVRTGPPREAPDIGVVVAGRATPFGLLEPEVVGSHWPMIPRVLVAWFDQTELWRLGPITGFTVVLPGVTNGRPTVIDSLLGEHLAARFRRRLAAELDLGPYPILRSGLDLSCGAPSAVGRPPPRSVGEVADRLGCSASFLYRQAAHVGLNLGGVLRQSVLLNGVWLYRTGIRQWTRVAVRLGFPSAAAWSNFVRRQCGRSPTEIAALTDSALVHLSIERVIPRH